MKKIKIENLNKKYNDTEVIKCLNLTINRRERLVLLGPSGCGKSTLLRIIAGLESITNGNLFFEDELMNDVEAGNRNVAMVFQNYALYPHLTVKDNISFALKMNKIPKEEIEKRVEKVIKILNLSGLENRYPKELSGGQRQRVSLGRAVVKHAPIFLLDEPLSNLDVQLRNSSREELVKLHNIFRSTFIYVTHDQIEAMTIGERIAVLNKGEIQQIDTPSNIYNFPKNTFVASFIGTPPMNLLNLTNYDGIFKINDTDYIINNILSTEKKLILGIRAEDIEINKNPSSTDIEGKVLFIENYGNKKCIKVSIGGQNLTVLGENDLKIKEQETVYLNFMKNKIHLFSGKTNLRIDTQNNLLEVFYEK